MHGEQERAFEKPAGSGQKDVLETRSHFLERLVCRSVFFLKKSKKIYSFVQKPHEKNAKIVIDEGREARKDKGMTHFARESPKNSKTELAVSAAKRGA